MEDEQDEYGKIDGDPTYRITRKTLSRAELKALVFIEKNETASVSDVAGHLHCKTFWAIQHLEFLAKNGFIGKSGVNEYKRLEVAKQ